MSAFSHLPPLPPPSSSQPTPPPPSSFSLLVLPSCPLLFPLPSLLLTSAAAVVSEFPPHAIPARSNLTDSKDGETRR
eukprot:768361-Hanusia_phi.AAC.3